MAVKNVVIKERRVCSLTGFSKGEAKSPLFIMDLNMQ